MRPRVHIAALLLTAAGGASAEGISGFLEENYDHTNTKSVDETGRTTRTEYDQLTQRYHLNFDHAFWPLLRLDAGGIFEQTNQWSRAGDGWNRTVNGFGTLSMGGPMLNAAGGYNYRSERISSSPYSQILENPSFVAGWRPIGLPSWSLRIDNQHIFDNSPVGFRAEDISTFTTILTGTYSPIRELTLQYSGNYTNPVDRVQETDSKALTQVARADFLKTFGVQGTVGAGVNVTDRRQKVDVTGTSGQVVTLQNPIAGLFAAERFPSTAAQIVLVSTPSLVDGNVTTPTTINLGTSVQAGGDRDPRDIGLQFANTITQVNTFYLWVNQQLPPEIWGRFQWSAWESDDNLTWTRQAATPTATFDSLQNRFEITVQTTAKQYLKLVTTPLDPAATTDRRFADIFVTEMQAVLVTSVTQSTGWQRSTSTTLTGNARTLLFVPELSYDFSGVFLHSEQIGYAQNTYTVTNGLTYTRKLNPFLLFTARLMRLDQDESYGHEGGFQYSTSLAANELPTLSHNLVYSGRSEWMKDGFQNQNSVTLYNRAVPYRGIGLLLGGSYSVVSSDAQTLKSLAVTGNFTIQPHRTLTFAALLGHSQSDVSAATGNRGTSVTNRVDGSVTFTPVPAIYLAGSLSRVITPPTQRTLVSGSLNLSPFPGGDLQLTLNYTETHRYETDGTTDRLFVPALRWNIKPATFLTVSWTLLQSQRVVAENETRTLTVNFQTIL